MHKATAALACAPAEVAAAVESALLDQGISGLTTTQIARRVPRLLADLDPTAAQASGAKTRDREVGVSCRPSHVPGLSELSVVLDSVQAARVMSAVEQLARQLHHDAVDVISLPQCRVDALVDLVLQNAHIDTHVVFGIPVMTGAYPNIPYTDNASFGRASCDSAYTGSTAGRGGSAHHHSHSGGGRDARSDAVRARVAALCDRVFPDPDTMGWTQIIRTENNPPPPPDEGWDSGGEGWSSSGWPDPPDDVIDDDPDHEIDWDTALALLVQSLPDPPTEGVFTANPHRGDYPAGEASAEPIGCLKPGESFAPSDPVDDGMPDSSVSGRSVAGLGPVIVPGVGTILPAHVLALTSTLGVSVARKLLDATTGVLVQATSAKYRPTAGIARFVRDRDQHCRFPGCTQPATYCDADHVIPWPAGATTPANLQCLCRHHHRVKHQTRWQVTMNTEGVCTWTSPSGRAYLTRPAD